MNHAFRSAISRRVSGVALVVLLVALCLPAAGVSAKGRVTASGGSARTATAPAAWSGRYDLYRSGVFSSQKKITWCVAASIQMMLNIIDSRKDHSRDHQRSYIRYARKHDRFGDPAITGTDGQGWVASLNHFGGLTNYHVVAPRTYAKAIRSAVRRLRKTGQPVGLIIDHHNHAWVMTGFEFSDRSSRRRCIQADRRVHHGAALPSSRAPRDGSSSGHACVVSADEGVPEPVSRCRGGAQQPLGRQVRDHPALTVDRSTPRLLPHWLSGVAL